MEHTHSVISGGDGADGLRTVKEAGGLAVVQDPATAERREMPEAVLAAMGVDHVVGPEEIGDFLSGLGRMKSIIPRAEGRSNRS